MWNLDVVACWWSTCSEIAVAALLTFKSYAKFLEKELLAVPGLYVGMR
jgi:hypothetical protein